MSTTTSTTVAPDDAGTVYPMPPKPAWATSTDLSSGNILHEAEVGAFRACVDDHAAEDVKVMLGRWDELSADSITVGPSRVFVLDAYVLPQDARELARLLVTAADVLEGLT